MDGLHKLWQLLGLTLTSNTFVVFLTFAEISINIIIINKTLAMMMTWVLLTNVFVLATKISFREPNAHTYC
jgi:hypothetical protein